MGASGRTDGWWRELTAGLHPHQLQVYALDGHVGAFHQQLSGQRLADHTAGGVQVASDQELGQQAPLETDSKFLPSARHQRQQNQGKLCVSHLADVLQRVGRDGEVHWGGDDFSFLRLESEAKISADDSAHTHKNLYILDNIPQQCRAHSVYTDTTGPE